MSYSLQNTLGFQSVAHIDRLNEVEHHHPPVYIGSQNNMLAREHAGRVGTMKEIFNPQPCS